MCVKCYGGSACTDFAGRLNSSALQWYLGRLSNKRVERPPGRQMPARATQNGATGSFFLTPFLTFFWRSNDVDVYW